MPMANCLHRAASGPEGGLGAAHVGSGDALERLVRRERSIKRRAAAAADWRRRARRLRPALAQATPRGAPTRARRRRRRAPSCVSECARAPAASRPRRRVLARTRARDARGARALAAPPVAHRADAPQSHSPGVFVLFTHTLDKLYTLTDRKVLVYL